MAQKCIVLVLTSAIKKKKKPKTIINLDCLEIRLLFLTSSVSHCIFSAFWREKTEIRNAMEIQKRTESYIVFGSTSAVKTDQYHQLLGNWANIALKPLAENLPFQKMFAVSMETEENFQPLKIKIIQGKIPLGTACV